MHRRAARRAGVGVLAAAITCLAALQAAPSAVAAPARTAVDSAVASPRSFVPDWDGHTDLTVLRYQLVERSSVTIRVLDQRGRIVASFRAGIREAGIHEATWDGRRTNGQVMPPGRYRLRVDAVPRPAPPAPGEPAGANAGVTIVGGARATTVVVRRPVVSLTSVQLTRTAIGKARSSTRAGARFRLSRAATVSVAVADNRGRIVRSLAMGRRRAGASSVAWDGRTSSGRFAADGTYSLVVSATGGGRPTATSRLPITIDRVVPRLRTATRAKAGVAGSAVRIPITVVASEPGTVSVRFGRRTWSQAVQRGTNKLVVDGARLGIVATKQARVLRLTVLLRDGAGNANGRRVLASIPARQRIDVPTTTLPPATTNPIIDVPAGKWPWPTDGVVTSEFGLRDGRPHEGLDIASPTGTPIHPVSAGTVSFVGSYGGYGNLVIVDHGDGVATRYAHLSRFGSFAVGASVAHTDVIGYVGCTGSCTGPHVHFETRVADTARNPRAFLVAR